MRVLQDVSQVYGTNAFHMWIEEWQKYQLLPPFLTTDLILWHVHTLLNTPYSNVKAKSTAIKVFIVCVLNRRSNKFCFILETDVWRHKVGTGIFCSGVIYCQQHVELSIAKYIIAKDNPSKQSVLDPNGEGLAPTWPSYHASRPKRH